MSRRQRRSRDTGSVVIRTRADGSQSFMLKWRHYVETVPVTSKGEALALLSEFITKAQKGHIEAQRAAAKAQSEQPTLAEWSETFLAQHVSQDPDRLATRAAYGSAMRLYVLPTLGKHRLHEIAPAMIRETMQELFRQGRAIRTLKLACAVLHRAFDAAIEDGYALQNPMPKFSKLRLGEAESAAEGARRAALNSAQVTALLYACGDPDLKLYVAIMAGCGLRPGECLGLHWRDVDLKLGVLHVRGSAKRSYAAPGEPRRIWIGKTKTASSARAVAMGPTLAALFAAERERQEAVQRELLGRDPNVRELKSLLPADACVFPGDATTAEGRVGPCDPDAMRSRFSRAAANAGLQTTPHALRHTHISHAIEGGLSLADTAARAGHSSVLTTAKTYVHSVSESQRRAALIGDSLLAPADGADAERLMNTSERDAGHK